jgi:peptide/nickel transport system substrate-binding protein
MKDYVTGSCQNRVKTLYHATSSLVTPKPNQTNNHQGVDMKRRDFLKITAATGGALAAGNVRDAYAIAQGDTPRTGGTLVWGHSETTQNIDIHQTGTASTSRMLQNVHETILNIDENFALQPALADSWEVSDDLLTYTFYLRPEVMFHDGTILSAEDVKYSWERIQNPDTGAVNFDVFNDVAEINALDDLTVEVKMSRVYSPFLERLTSLGCAIIPAGSGETTGTQPIGAGPFQFIEREFGNRVELARWDNYYRGPAFLDAIVSREVTEATVRLTGLRTGEMDMINDIPLDRVADVESDSDLQVRTWYPLSWAFLNFNHNVAPFDDPNVRLAFDHMIDKEVLVQGALWGQGEVTATPSFPNSPYRNSALTARPQDFDEARRLLAASGYDPSDINVTFKVTTNYPWHVEAAQIMLEWFRIAGVNAEVVQLTWSDWLSQCWINRDFDITMVNFFTLWEPDFLYYSIWHSTGAFNFRSVQDSLLDDLLQQARENTDTDARVALYQQVQQRIFEQGHDVFLWYRNGSLAASNRVRGLDSVVHPNASNLNFWRVWLDDA